MRTLLFCAEPENLQGTLALSQTWGAGVHVQAFYHQEIIDDPLGEINRHTEALRDFSRPLAMHGPFWGLNPGSDVAYWREKTANLIRRGINIATVLKIPDITLHFGNDEQSAWPDDWLERATDFWREILAFTPQNIRLHLENYREHDPGIMLELLDAIGDPRLGVCLDIGHVCCYSTASPRRWISTLGIRITLTHLHDNHGCADEHLPLGAGSLPVNDMLALLEEHAPNAMWAIEAPIAPSVEWMRGNGWGW